MRRVVHFEIHVIDPERAQKFYSIIFGWEIKKWGEMPYWMVMTGTKDSSGADGKPWPGIDGGMVLRTGEVPADDAPVNGYVCTMDVDDIDAYTTKVQEAGGSIAVPKTAIPTMGWLVYCKDTEGNRFGMMQADPAAK